MTIIDLLQREYKNKFKKQLTYTKRIVAVNSRINSLKKIVLRRAESYVYIW